METSKAAFLEEKKEEIKEYEEYTKAQEDGFDDYEEENDDEEEGGKGKQVPTMPVFNEEQFLAEWDAENPEIIIGDEPKDQIDNDWVLTEEEMAENIKKYMGPEDP